MAAKSCPECGYPLSAQTDRHGVKRANCTNCGFVRRNADDAPKYHKRHANLRKPRIFTDDSEVS